MSARNRHAAKELRRAVRATDADPRGYWETSTGWSPDEDGCEKVMVMTAKMVRERLGPRRTGEVQFTVVAGDQARAHLADLRSKLVELKGPESEVMANHYRRIGAQLREYGGVVITALAPGFPPA